jgi:monoamine oxidase
MGMLLDVAYTIEYGGDSTDQSALNLVYLLGYKANPGNFAIFGASDERFHIVGGNQQLPLAIASALPGGTVQTSMRLSALRLNSDGSYTLTFNDRQDVTADYVILALPFAVLRMLNYQAAGFDALKNTAIQQLGSGRNGKLQLQFGSRFWNGPGPWPGISNGASYSDTGYQCTWDVTRGQAGATGILVDYTGGSVSAGMSTRVPWANAANAQVQSDAQRFLSQAAPVFPGIGGQWNGKATSSLPFLDPNFNCSYSYWRVGQCVAFSGYEKARQGNVFFGGEHCSQDFQGFMEGGAMEGARAANEVLATIGRR